MTLYVISREEPYASLVLRHLRDRETPPPVFRAWLRRAGALLAAKIARVLPLRTVRVATPLGEAVEAELEAQPLVVSVLGAGQFLAEGILDLYPEAPLGFVAARRVEEGDAVSVSVTYERLPGEWRGPAIVADPMLATGVTLAAVIGRVARIGAGPIAIASVIAVPEGVKRLEKEWPGVDIFTLALDRGLNSRFFIVPGLGDAGDRSLGVIA